MRAALQARNNTLWLAEVARKYGVPGVVLARQLRTTRALTKEAAILLNDVAQSEARTLVATDKRPPQDDDLFSELIRRHYAVLFAAHKKSANQAAKKALAAELKAS